MDIQVTVIAIQVTAAIEYLRRDFKSGRFVRRSIVSKLKQNNLTVSREVATSNKEVAEPHKNGFVVAKPVAKASILENCLVKLIPRLLCPEKA